MVISEQEFNEYFVEDESLVWMKKERIDNQEWAKPIFLMPILGISPSEEKK